MTIVKNEDLFHLCEMSDAEIGIIVRAQNKDGVQRYLPKRNEWEDNLSALFPHEVYRTTPGKQLNVPWDRIPKHIKHVAMNKNKRVHGFLSRPEVQIITWSDYGKGILLSDAIVFDTEGIEWDTSALERPEDV